MIPTGDIPAELAPPGPAGVVACQAVLAMLDEQNFLPAGKRHMRFWYEFDPETAVFVELRFTLGSLELASATATVWCLGAIREPTPAPPPHRTRVPYITVDLGGYHADPAEVVAHAIGLVLGPGGNAVDWRASA